MKSYYTGFKAFSISFLLLIIHTAISTAQVTTLWQKSQSSGNLPAFFGSNSERGIAYGNVGGNDRLYVVKNNPVAVIILNAMTGDSVGILDVTGITGGTFALNDLEVSSDGVIFGCNLTTSASTTAFKVYKWTSESATPVEVISYTGAAYRLGDLFTVVGSASDNSLTIYAAQSVGANIVKFTTTDNGNTFTPSVITVSGFTSLGTLPKVYPTASGFWTNGYGQNLRQLDPTGVSLGSVDRNLVPTNSSSIIYFTSNSKEYLLQYLYGPSTTSTSIASWFERAFILDVTGGYNTVKNVGFTPFLGSNTNTNGTGDVAIKNNGDGTFTVFVLSTNNGIGAYTINPATLTDILTPPTQVQNFEEFWPPANWMRYSGYLLPTSTLTSVTTIWVPDDFGNVISPVNRSAKINIYGTSRYHWLVTPTINLGTGTTNYQLEYDVALTKFAATTQDTLGIDDTLAVVISTDNGVTWSSANIIKLYTSADFIPPTGKHEIIDLTGYTGLVKIGFYGASSVSNKDNDIFIDNFEVKEKLTVPIIVVNPTSKDFGEVQINTTSSPQTFTISNNGAGVLTITSISLTGTNSSEFILTDTNTYPVNLNLGESITVQVIFAPTSVSSKSANLTIVHNAAGSPTDIPLTGTGIDATVYTFPYVQDFESTAFPPTGWLNIQVSGTGLFDRVTSGTNPAVTPKSGSAMVRFKSYNYSSGTSAALISPPLNLTHNNFRLRFWMYRDAGYSSNADRILIYVNNQPSLAGAVFVDSINRSISLYPTVTADGWYEYLYMIPNIFTGVRYVVLQAISAYGNNMFIDSLAIESLGEIGWANLQWPGTATITAGDSILVFGQVWIDGVTNQSGQTPGLEAWVGINSSDTNPSTWTNWKSAVFNMDVGNNDEFMAHIGQDLVPDTYYYAFRYKYLQSDYKYGGFSSTGGGFWDGTNYVSGVLTVNPATGPLSGDYYIPQGSYPKGFPTLDSAFKAINVFGQSGDVRFLIDSDLNEIGANLVLTKTDTAYLLTIKPAPNKTPTIYITGCTSVSGANQYTGIELNGAKYILFDGSNTDGGTTRDLTIAMNDSLNGRIAIQLYGNADYVTIRNLVIKYLTMNPTFTTTRGVYVNGQASGVTDYFSVENCKIGDDIYQPAYAVSVTGYSGTGTYASNIYINKNELYGHLRTVYFFYAGVFAEIMDNEIKGTVPPPSGNVRWGILFNTYNGIIQIANNRIQTLRMASSSTNGIYGIGTLSAASGTELLIYNNFLGGDFTHTGTGVPASVDVISFQDNIPSAKVYHNTIVLNDIGKLASSRMTGIRWGGTANVELKNNIIVNNVNASVAYCLYHGSGTFTSNNNAFYVSGANGNLGYYNGAVQTLQAWKDSTGQDGSSVVENPPFVGGLDFHIQPNSITLLESSGTPVPVVGIDIDWEPRDPSTPDIGADEFVGFNPNNLPDTVDIAYRRLWNIVSVPLNASDMTAAALFPNAASNAFWFDGSGYVVKDTLEVGKGYWLKFNVDSLTTVTGPRKDSLVINVNEGWNLIGTLSVDIPTTNVSSNPSGIIVSNFFGFSNKYYQSDVLKEGQGYWVKTSAAGTLTLRKTVLAKSGDELYVESIDPKWRKIVITDAAGVSEELYLADQVDELRYYSLPPLPPLSVFDVRFDSDRYVEVDNYTHRINLQGVKYPVTLTITNAEKGFYRVKDAIDGSYLNVVLKNGEPIKIINPNIQAILIEGATVPTQFDLMQNYPNPFNPTTTIRYAIAEPVKVKLVVYNAVGQKVKELVNIEQEAGYYTVEFNASNLASGVYLIRLETPKFSKTIKSLLIK